MAGTHQVERPRIHTLPQNLVVQEHLEEHKMDALGLDSGNHSPLEAAR